MLIANPKLFRTIWLISLLFLLPGLPGIHVPDGLLWAVFGGLMLVTGIPHGATDHVIHAYLNQAGKRVNWGRFLSFYLLLMLLYSLAWWMFPAICLTLFLGMSAYHFGQSQELYIRWENGSLAKRLLSISWGTVILASLLLMHIREVSEVLSPIVVLPTWVLAPSPLLYILVLVLPALLVLGLWAKALIQGAMKRAEFGREILCAATLLLAFYAGGLWLGFALYFGIWHSLSSMLAEIEEFRQARTFNWQQFFREALPFSIISVVGVALLLLLPLFWGEQVPLVLLFFIAISVLTLPHTLYMDRFYQHFPPHRLMEEQTAGS